MKVPISGLVAEVLNARELVINRGSEHGVEPGMKFPVLDPKSQNIEDPETGEVLGSVHRPKVEVKVVRVEPKLAFASTFKTNRRNIGGRGIGVVGGDLFKPPKYITEYETFKTTTATWENISAEQSYVQVGDRVEEVIELQDFEEPQSAA